MNCGGYRARLKAYQMRLRSLIVALALFGFVVAPCLAQNSYQKKADELAVLLNWHPGSVVGEIGAGEGQITVAAAGSEVSQSSSRSRANSSIPIRPGKYKLLSKVT